MTQPRRIKTHTAGIPAGGWVRVGVRDIIEWEDPETGRRYRTRRQAEDAIARRRGLTRYHVEADAIGTYYVADERGRMVGSERYPTRAAANAAAREMTKALEQ